MRHKCDHRPGSFCRGSLTDEETFALLNLLVDTIEADRYPMSPRIRLLRGILHQSRSKAALTAAFRRYKNSAREKWEREAAQGRAQPPGSTAER